MTDAVCAVRNADRFQSSLDRGQCAQDHLRIHVAHMSKTEETVTLTLSGPFEATTNRGGDFPLLSVVGPDQILAGEQAEVVVVVEDAPAWLGVKFLRAAAVVFGTVTYR